MKPLGFRQANAWLHTWVSLLLGWLLYAIFVTGTLSFFQQEISFWMKPELHASQPDEQSASRAIEQLQAVAPTAAAWNISLPTERNPALEVQWFAQGERPNRRGGERLTLDAGNGEVLNARETRGGGFLYRFHFELYGLPREAARWIVAVATMLMLIAIVSGVVTHKKIFKDFFTFRPRKGQRSWLDAHNATAVLALPFHFMITYSGLLLFMFMLMPWGIESAYQGDRQAFFDEGFRRGGAPVMTESKPAPGTSASLTAIAPLLMQAEQYWPRGAGSLQIHDPGTSRAVIELRENGGNSLINRGGSQVLRFDGVSGAPLDAPATPTPEAASAVYNVFSSLHLIRFAGPALRWVFFFSGVLGTLMIVTGMVLWVVKRLPERRKLGRTPVGHRLVEVLNVGAIAGLPVAIAVYFWANRLLPVELAQRSDWEIRSFLLAWLLCLLHPLLRSHKRAWVEQLLCGAVLFAGLPIYALSLPHSGLNSSLFAGNWLLASMDLTLLGTAAVLVGTTYAVIRHQPLRQAKPAPRKQPAAVQVSA